VAFGSGWGKGRIDDEDVPSFYQRARLGLNVHNSLGPINGRMYDLAAFGVCQVCDNKSTLSLVFEEGKEIVGFQSKRECVEMIRYYLSKPDEARRIGRAGQERFLRDYTMSAIWTRFFSSVTELVEAGSP